MGDPSNPPVLPQRRLLLRCLLVAAVPTVVHLLTIPPVEPVFGGDSNRHVMTSVFFRDFLADGTYTNPKGYAEAYFEQYPALGLLVWPPLFHAVCGILMLAGGTSAEIARLLVYACCVLAAVSVFRITYRERGEQSAILVTIVFAIFPLVFQYSRDVMLEVPALALVLLSVERFDLWLRSRHPRCLYLAAAAASLAALTRFDAVVLLPFFLFALLFKRRWSDLRTHHVPLAVLLAVVTVVPVYGIILKEAGGLHLRQASESVGGALDGSQNAFLKLSNFWFYPSVLAEQAGPVAAAACVAGVLLALLSAERAPSAIMFALLLATYVTFSPLAELRSRHAIYWLPSVAWFSVLAVEMCLRQLARILPALSRPLVSGSVYAILISATAMASVREPACRVEGYREAAAWVLQQTGPQDRVFFDGWWDGNFTYYMRHLDPTRSRSVIRGDRLLYDFVCVPSTDFQQYVETSDDILKAIRDAGPKFVVLENPQFYEFVEIAQQLRDVVHSHPQVFLPEKTVRVRSTLEQFPFFELQIFRVDREALCQQTARDSGASPDEQTLRVQH